MYPHFYLRLPQEAQLQGGIVFDRKKKGGEGYAQKSWQMALSTWILELWSNFSSHNLNKKNLTSIAFNEYMWKSSNSHIEHKFKFQIMNKNPIYFLNVCFCQVDTFSITPFWEPSQCQFSYLTQKEKQKQKNS